MCKSHAESPVLGQGAPGLTRKPQCRRSHGHGDPGAGCAVATLAQSDTQPTGSRPLSRVACDRQLNKLSARYVRAPGSPLRAQWGAIRGLKGQVEPTFEFTSALRKRQLSFEIRHSGAVSRRSLQHPSFFPRRPERLGRGKCAHKILGPPGHWSFRFSHTQ
jgi:hypothetical protein